MRSFFIAAAMVVAASSASTVPPGTQASSPVVGVMTHPGPQTFLAASYVKWIESAGGRVVPIPYAESRGSVLDEILMQVNGVLFPGGASALSDGARHIYSKAIELNEAGDYFPLWATCLGFEWVMEMQSGNDGILTGNLDSENLTVALDFASSTTRRNASLLKA